MIDSSARPTRETSISSIDVIRPYQETTAEEALARYRAGRRAPLIVLPTGGGKTVLIIHFGGRHLAKSHNHKILVISHRREIGSQIAERFRRHGIAVAEICPGGTVDPDARVFVASIQSLLARGTLPEGISLVIYDEAHHYSADEWSSVTTAYPDAIRLGFTATPCRSDGRGLSPAFDSMVVGATIKQLTEAGYLVPCRVIAPDRPLRSRQLTCRPVDAYLEHAAGRRTVVFAEFVADATEFRDEFIAAGVPAVVVHGELPAEEREAALRAHQEDGAVLLSVMCLTEGWDSPTTEVCILARGCGSVGTYLQIVGRILRPSPGKAEALLIDLTGRAFYAHGAPDAERVFSLTGKGIRKKDGTEGKTCFTCGSLVDVWPCDVCGYEPEGGVSEPLRIVGGDLAERYAEKRTEDVRERIETLARWVAEARARGWKDWSVVRKYQHVYGRPPSSGYLAEARMLAPFITCSECTVCGRATAKTYGGRCGKCAFGAAQKGAA